MYKPILNTILWSMLLIPLLWLSQWNHPAADDYCYANVYNSQGLLQSVVQFHLTWSGRFTATALSGFILADQSFVFYRLWAVLMLVAVVGGLLYFTNAFPGWKNRTDRWIAAALFLFLFFDRTIEFSDTIYWANGVIPYMLSVPGILIIWTFLRDSRGKQHHAWFFGLLAFLLSGLSEFAAIMQLSIIGLCTLEAVAVNPAERKDRLKRIAVLASGALGGAIIAFTAPGNQARSQVFENRFDFWHAVSGTVTVSQFLLRKWFRYSPLLPFSLFFLIVLRKHTDVGHPLLAGKAAFLLPLTLPGILFLGLFPALFATGGPPGGRTGNALFFLFLIFWFGNLAALKPWLHKIKPGILWITFAILVLITRWNGGNFAQSVFPDLTGRARQYHDEMENRYRILRNPDISEALVPPLSIRPPSIYHDDITTDPDDWRNSCKAQYFGKNAIRIQE